MERTHTITLAADAAAQYAELSQQVDAVSLIANRTEDGLMREQATAHLAELTEQLHALQDEIAAGARTVTLTRLPPRQYARLMVEHPARPGDQYDERMGYNTDTVTGPLMDACITSVVDADGAPVEFSWEDVQDDLSPADFHLLVNSVISMHEARDAVPFSLDEWRTRHASEQSSK